MPEPSPLTPEETAALREVLATGKQPTVWFTAAAVGVPEGKSGKVTALGDPADGDFIQVRPTGSQDVLSFGAAEVTVTKPPRQPRKPRESAAPAPEPAVAPATPPTDLGAPAWTPDPAPELQPQPATADKPAAPVSTARRRAARRPAAVRLAKGRQAPNRKARPVEMIVTLSANLEGEWVLDVVSGKKRVAKALPLSPAVVAKVAKVLPPDVEDAIDLALDAARDHQRSRVEELEAELAEAKRALDELFG